MLGTNPAPAPLELDETGDPTSDATPFRAAWAVVTAADSAVRRTLPSFENPMPRTCVPGLLLASGHMSKMPWGCGPFPECGLQRDRKLLDDECGEDARLFSRRRPTSARSCCRRALPLLPLPICSVGMLLPSDIYRPVFIPPLSPCSRPCLSLTNLSQLEPCHPLLPRLMRLDACISCTPLSVKHTKPTA